MISIFYIGIILFTGFLFGEIATKFKLPKVTGYIIGGILLNPEISHFVPNNFSDNMEALTNICLSFITFTVGSTLLLPKLKRLGKSILLITLCESEFAFIFVAIGFLAVSPFLVNIVGASFTSVFIPISLLIASLASPTDPSATLAVIHEYNAKGNVSSTVMGVAAFDDALGIINYSIAVAVAGVLISHSNGNIFTYILKTIFYILGAGILGTFFGLIFNVIQTVIKKEKEGVLIILVFAFLSLCFGAASALGVDELLSTMAMGVVVVNFNKQREKIFKMLERYTEELIFVIFFTLSGMQLDFNILSKSILLVILFFICRMTGKVIGAYAGALLSKASAKVRKYTAGGLIPQGGIVIGLALMIQRNSNFNEFSDIILSIVIGSTVIHELVGPIFAKKTLEKAGEISLQTK